MASPSPQNHPTAINRYYIDTRPYVPHPSNPKSLHALPLLATLQRADQDAVTRFIRPADRFMSLASALLKYTFIHRRARIPWSDVQISRTPHPHKRPYWEPPEDWSSPDPYASFHSTHDAEPRLIRGLEFNVSHQAGLVAIIGCATPTAQLPSSHHDASNSNYTLPSPTIIDSLAQIDLNTHPTTCAFEDPSLIRLGLDIACTNEDKRTPKDLDTQSKLDEWIDIFAEMFSDRERRHMSASPVHIPVKEREEGADWDSDSSSDSPPTTVGDREKTPAQAHETKVVGMKLRRFYAYWALKEAYIKMVGEGLLADWLRELEFLDVVAPQPPPRTSRRSSTAAFLQRPTLPEPQGHVKGQANAKEHAYLSPFPDSPSTPSPVLVRSGPSSPGSLHTPLETSKWTAPEKSERGMSTLLRGKRVRDVDIELVAYDEDFIVATALRGVEEQEVTGSGFVRGQWLRLDIDGDIRPCAEGRCTCLK